MDVRDAAAGTLREHALLADGERGALVGPCGDIAILCAPRWHDPGAATTGNWVTLHASHSA